MCMVFRTDAQNEIYMNGWKMERGEDNKKS